MAMEQLEQSPDPGTAPEFALGELQRRLAEHAAEELRVEVEREVDGEPHALRVPPAFDVLVSSHSARLSDIAQTWRSARSIRVVVTGAPVDGAVDGLVRPLGLAPRGKLRPVLQITVRYPAQTASGRHAPCSIVIVELRAMSGRIALRSVTGGQLRN